MNNTLKNTKITNNIKSTDMKNAMLKRTISKNNAKMLYYHDEKYFEE